MCAVFAMLFQPVERIAPLTSSNEKSDPAVRNEESSVIEADTSFPRKKILNWALLKSPTMILLCLSCLVQGLGFLIPYIYLSGNNYYKNKNNYSL